MVYSVTISTPANTAKTSLKRTLINVTKGLVYKVEFYFPPGSVGLMGVAVFDGLYQCWPSIVGEYFTTDDETISFDDLLLKSAAPFTFQCYTYNEDTVYAHNVGVRIGLVSDDAFIARFLPTKGRAYFEKLRTRMLVEREQLAAEQRAKAAGTLLERLILEKEETA